MKSFTEYLTESKKTYEFKIKVAGDLKETFQAELKSAMEKFAVASLSTGKRTPIQEVPLDFPTLKNANVTVFDLAVHYPTTPQVLEAYIGQICGCPAGTVVVKTANDPSEEYQKQLDDKATPILGEEQDDADNSGQELVGEKRISSFLKDIAQASKDRSCEGQPKEKAAPMPDAGVSISPVGSKQNQIPSPVKGK